MEQVADVQEFEQQKPAPTEDSIHKELKLEWVDSEWFQVWLKLARGQHHGPN